MKMNNYYWCSVDCEEVVIPKEGMNYSLAGEGYGREGFKDGAKIHTSPVVCVKDGVVQTASGSRYELGNMHPDYIEILSAIEAGIPVIKDWSLSGDLRDGYVLTGHVGDDIVRGKVTSQEGNYITMNDTRYLVIWSNLRMDSRAKREFAIKGKYCDLRFERDFSEYMIFTNMRPNLME